MRFCSFFFLAFNLKYCFFFFFNPFEHRIFVQCSSIPYHHDSHGFFSFPSYYSLWLSEWCSNQKFIVVGDTFFIYHYYFWGITDPNKKNVLTKHLAVISSWCHSLNTSVIWYSFLIKDTYLCIFRFQDHAARSANNKKQMLEHFF